MPEMPTLPTNGHPDDVQAGSSISSLEPATRFMGLVGFWAIAGSFCLFCGKGDGCTRLVWVSKSSAAAAAGVTPTASAVSPAASAAKGLQVIVMRTYLLSSGAAVGPACGAELQAGGQGGSGPRSCKRWRSPAGPGSF